MKKIIKILIILGIGLILGYLFFKYPAPHDRILNIQNYLITVGGIISAFVIAYLSAKIFNIKSERDNRQVLIDKFSSRLTAFRQIMYIVMNSRQFWVNYDHIAIFKKDFPNCDYESLRGDSNKECRQLFYSDDFKLSQGTISLYTAMEAIYDKVDKYLIPWAYERAPTERYNINDLSKYHEPCNQIWYYLDGRFAKHGKGLFNDDGISNLDKKNFEEKLAIADIRYKGKDFHRLILADLGNEFYEYVIPKMAELIKQNTGVPKELLNTFYSLLAIMLFGVIFPIILQSLSVSNCIDLTLTLTFVNLTTISLLYFLIEFYDFIKVEVETNKKSSS